MSITWGRNARTLVSLETEPWRDRLERSERVLASLGTELGRLLQTAANDIGLAADIPTSIYLVGSGAEGRLCYDMSRRTGILVSDLDLLLVIPDDVEEIERLHNRVARALSDSKYKSGGNMLGVRIRRLGELPAFSFKYVTLGCDFPSSAVVLAEGCQWAPPQSLRFSFSLGHYAENLCSKLWAIARYCGPDDWERSDVGLRRKAESACRYLEGARTFARDIFGEQRSCEDELRGGLDLAGTVSRANAIYGEELKAMTLNSPDACLSAQSEEEFDCFRISKGDSGALAEAICFLLEIGSSRRLTPLVRERLEVACERLGIGEGLGIQLGDWKEVYGRVRLAIGKKRFLRCALFRRDRGPGFLEELGRPPARGRLCTASHRFGP
jgi:hypothetical protein